VKPVATLGTVNANNIYSQVWTNLYAIVNTISDPASRGVQWIYAAFPQEVKHTASVYPAIIIDSPNALGKNVTFTHVNRYYEFDIPISIYATRMDTCDGLASTVLSTLNNNRGSLEANGMQMFNPESSPTFHSMVANQMVHEKRINIKVVSYV
jgi:hypothetical protein